MAKDGDGRHIFLLSIVHQVKPFIASTDLIALKVKPNNSSRTQDSKLPTVSCARVKYIISATKERGKGVTFAV
jgi:hypothetical protein